MDRSSRRVCFAISTQYLSDDLISKILMRLPVKSLVRFCSVCKSWRSLISSEEFIGSHLKHQQSHTLNTFDPLLAFHHNPDFYTNNFHLVRYNQLHSVNELYSPDSSFQIHPPGSDRLFEDYEVMQIGFCDGLICLLCAGTTIMICNPSTRKSATISLPKINEFGFYYYGFGHDARNDDYKIVSLCINDDYIGSNVEVHVYSLKTRAWKVIVNDLGNRRPAEDQSCLAGGHIHWVTIREAGAPPFLLSFDLTYEVFRQMELPPRSHPDIFYNLLPTATKHGKVSLLACNHDTDMSSVWELGELGVPGSWTELHPTEEPVNNPVALGLENIPNRTGSRRLVIHSIDGLVLNSTELESGLVKQHCCLKLFSEQRSTFIGFANYMESLVMLNYDSTSCSSQFPSSSDTTMERAPHEAPAPSPPHQPTSTSELPKRQSKRPSKYKDFLAYK